MAGSFVDLVGKRFGKFVVVSRNTEKVSRSAIWTCECDCGNTVERTTSKLNLGPTCGCGITVYNHAEEKLSGEKVCRSCGVTKPLSEYPSAEKPNGIGHDCKACVSISTKLRFFKITKEKFLSLRERARDCCEICGTTEAEALASNNKTKHYGLYIDHNHSTGEVRGMLCHNCNLIIGHAKDDVNLLNAAAKYLEREAL